MRKVLYVVNAEFEVMSCNVREEHEITSVMGEVKTAESLFPKHMLETLSNKMKLVWTCLSMSALVMI